MSITERVYARQKAANASNDEPTVWNAVGACDWNGALRAVRGFGYDLRHLASLPGRTSLQKLRFATTRDDRSKYLIGVATCLVVAVILLCVLCRALTPSRRPYIMHMPLRRF